MRKKTSLTRTLMASCAVFALSAVMYGCVHSGDDPVVEPPPVDMDDEANALAAAKMAAMEAAEAASAASVAARAAQNTAAAHLTDESSQAMDAERYAIAARDASVLADEANRRAQAATTSAAAQAEQAEAEKHRDAALVAQRGAAGEAADAKLVVDSRADAAEAAMAARTAATDARMHAGLVSELTGATSDSTASANMYAMAAEEAADAAEMAKMNADAVPTGMLASAAASDAIEAQGTAEDNEMLADELRRQVQLAHDVDETDDEAEALADAQEATSAAATQAAGLRDQIARAADVADGHASAAEKSVSEAKAARTNYPAAAQAAAVARGIEGGVGWLLEMAEDHLTAANDANTAAMEAETSEDAEAEKAKAEAAVDALKLLLNGDPDAGPGDENYVQREGAVEAATQGAPYWAMKAEAARHEHVISLLIHANAQDLDLGDMDDVDLPSALAKAKETRLMRVSGAIGSAAGTAGTDADNDSSTPDGSGGTTAMATWPAFSSEDTPANPATEDEDAVVGMLSIAVNPNTDNVTAALTFNTVAAEENDTGTAFDDTIKTATALSRGLGDFGHGYQIEEGANHAIVFTDKQQGTPAVAEVTFIAAEELVNDAVTGNTITDLGTRSGTGYTGVTYYEGSATADTDPDTAFVGSLACPDATECEVSIAENGAISVTGFTFTGSRAERAAVAEADAAENDDYLAFGVWLIEDDDTSTDGNQPAIAAFANGGEGITNFEDDGTNNDNYAHLTGTARYTGKAGGVHTDGSSVDWFEGDATLTADFGEKPETGDDTERGAISGMIDNIFAGGVLTGDVINLRKADIAAQNSAFSGNADMGPGVDTDNDNVLEYTYNGTWSGNFFGSNPAVANDPATDADESMDAAGPDAVAGTFGVTGTMGEGDAAITRSYVGAFGARKQD